MTKRPLAKTFGQTLRNLRIEKGLSQEKLAFEAGITRNYVSLLELSQRSPTLDTLESLAGALDISVSTLIGRAERAAK